MRPRADRKILEGSSTPRFATDYERLHGTWDVYDVVEGGEHKSQERLAQQPERMVFQDRSVIIDMMGTPQKFALRLDYSKSPRQIDCLASDRSELLGIYEIDGETLRVCLAQPNEPRPESFEAGRGSRRRLMTLQKSSPIPDQIRIPTGQDRKGAADVRLRLSPKLREALRKAGLSESEFQSTFEVALSRAAGVTPARLTSLMYPPSPVGPADAPADSSEPLSLLVLTEAPPKGADHLQNFRLLTSSSPDPRELYRAMSISEKHGYASVIQPEYIKHTQLAIDEESGRLTGRTSFAATDLYEGTVEFTLLFDRGRMEVRNFTLPGDDISISLAADGSWRRQSVQQTHDAEGTVR